MHARSFCFVVLLGAALLLGTTGVHAQPGVIDRLARPVDRFPDLTVQSSVPPSVIESGVDVATITITVQNLVTEEVVHSFLENGIYASGWMSAADARNVVIDIDLGILMQAGNFVGPQGFRCGSYGGPGYYDEVICSGGTLASGSSVQFQIGVSHSGLCSQPQLYPEGQRFYSDITVTVDPDNTIAEASETNNRVMRTIEILPAPC